MTGSVVQDLANAYTTVAKVNHYMVGVVGKWSYEHLEAARQILIGQQNALEQGTDEWGTLELALDLIDLDVKKL